MGMLGGGMRMPGLGGQVTLGPKMSWMQWGAPQAQAPLDPGDPLITKKPPDPTGGGAPGAGLGATMNTPLTLTGQNAVQITPGMQTGPGGAPNMSAPETLSGVNLQPLDPRSLSNPPPATLDGVNIPGALGAAGAAEAANPIPTAAAVHPALLSRLSQLLGFL